MADGREGNVTGANGGLFPRLTVIAVVAVLLVIGGGEVYPSTWSRSSALVETQRSALENAAVLADVIAPIPVPARDVHASALPSNAASVNSAARGRIYSFDDEAPMLAAQVLPVNPQLTDVAAQTYRERFSVTALQSRDRGADRAVFQTAYNKIHCGAIVANLCVWNGQPRYFRDGRQPFVKSGATLCCSEAGAKHRFPMVMHAPLSVSTSDIASNGVLMLPTPSQSTPYIGDSILVVPYCWELYGYHLFLCLQATFAQLQRLGIADLKPKVVYVAMLRGGSFTPWAVGSENSWEGERREGAESKDGVVASKYWPLWKTIAPRPSLVAPAPVLPRTCYSMAVIGGEGSNDLTPAESAAWRSVALERLGMRRTRPVTSCGNYKVAVLQRKTNFFVKDTDATMSVLKEALGGTDIAVHTLETMSFRQQLQLALDVDVLVGVHGNGLAWSTFMTPGSTAMIELWPHHAYNGNYNAITRRANVRLFSSVGDGQCANRCSASYAKGLRDGVATEVRAFLDAAHCHGQLYNVSARYVADMLEAKARKDEKRRLKNKA
jgi:hypothetical protein